MKANYRRFQRPSKGYSRILSKGDLHRTLSEEDLDLVDDASSQGYRGFSHLLDREEDRVVLTRGGSRSERDERFAVLRAWQRERRDSAGEPNFAQKAPASGGWFARMWRRLLGR